MSKKGKHCKAHSAAASAQCTNHYTRSVMQLEGVVEERLSQVGSNSSCWCSCNQDACYLCLLLVPSPELRACLLLVMRGIVLFVMMGGFMEEPCCH